MGMVILIASACGPSYSERRLTYEEELEIRSLQEQGQYLSPQEQKIIDCRTESMRKPKKRLDAGDVLTEMLTSEPECPGVVEQPKRFNMMKDREKQVDEIIDRQLKEQSTR